MYLQKRDDFWTWLDTHLHDAEVAVHNGDPAPRPAVWSRNEPVSVLGAVMNAHGQQELDALFATLGERFSNCTSYEFELLSYYRKGLQKGTQRVGEYVSLQFRLSIFAGATDSIT